MLPPQYRAPALLLPFVLATASRAALKPLTKKNVFVNLARAAADAVSSASLVWASRAPPSHSPPIETAGLVLCVIGAAVGATVALHLPDDALITLSSRHSVRTRRLVAAAAALIVVIGASLLAAVPRGGTALGFVSLLPPVFVLFTGQFENQFDDAPVENNVFEMETFSTKGLQENSKTSKFYSRAPISGAVTNRSKTAAAFNSFL